MKLIIVESPNKIKKIKELLGADYEVAASVGHIRDLPSKELGIDRSKGYRMAYETNLDKRQVVANLKQAVAKVGINNVLLATDPDREGEAIAYHLCQVLGIDPRQSQRISFQEITAKAIQSALTQIQPVNLKLVSAQEARRAIDRLVGYEVSPLLWKKIGGKLSAGRVQSVALRLVVERERMITGFSEKFSYKGSGDFVTANRDTIRAHRQEPFATLEAAQTYLALSPGKAFTVSDVQTRPVEKHPPAPFTTSTLQQEGIRKFKWTAKKVMEVAQKLFESGHITYMRTDSPHLSEEAVLGMRGYIEENWGDAYFQARRFKSKETAQEAHEAIRPTHLEETQAGNSDDDRKLYRLIYTRAIASQMAPARYLQTIVTIQETDPTDVYTAKASILQFEGFTALYQEEENEDQEQEEETTITGIAVGDRLIHSLLRVKQTYSMPPRRFDEATLVKELENRGIGRPSTYASILNTITSKEYAETRTVSGRKISAIVLTWTPREGVRGTSEPVSIGGDKNKFVPTQTGNSIIAFLESHYIAIVNYDFTAQVEEMLDQITEGAQSFGSVVSAFDSRHRNLMDAANSSTMDVAPKESSTRELGEWNGKPARVGKSKFGTYIVYEKKFYSLPSIEPDQVTLEHLREAIAVKSENPPVERIAKIGAYEIRRGQYGLYVTDGTTKASLKNKTDEEAARLTAKDCKEIIKGYLEWKRKSSTQKK